MNYYKRVDELVNRALMGEDVTWLLGQMGIFLDNLNIEQNFSYQIKKTFESEVSNKKLLKRHSVAPYIIAAVLYKLQDERDNRIMTATTLAKINKEKAKETVMQRFAGWASSIPVLPQNRAKVNKVKLVRELIKPIAKDLNKQDKLLANDQSRKMLSNIDSIIANEAGAIGYYWHSLFRVPGYKYRIEHKHLDLDGKFIILKDNWALKNGLMKKDGQLYQDQIEQPGELPNCRCSAIYVYKLDEIPLNCLTNKGIEYKKGI
jgi:hypothetical protein